jgi:hypothetical protein
MLRLDELTKVEIVRPARESVSRTTARLNSPVCIWSPIASGKIGTAFCHEFPCRFALTWFSASTSAAPSWVTFSCACVRRFATTAIKKIINADRILM